RAFIRFRTIKSSAGSGIVIRLCHLSDIFLLLQVKRLLAVLFRDCQISPEANLGDDPEPFAPKSFLGRPRLEAESPGTDPDHLGTATDLCKKRRIGAGHPHLAVQLRKFRMKA